MARSESYSSRAATETFRLSRRGFLFKAIGVGGAAFSLMLAQACRGQGPAPSYSGGQPPAPTTAPAAAATQAPAAAAPASKPAESKPAAAAPAASQPAPAAQPAAGGQPKRGGMLISAVTAEPVSLDPHLQFPATWTSLIYDDL